MTSLLRLLPRLLAVASLLLAGAGCAHTHRRAEGNRVAIALTVNGTEQPNPEQWANLIAALKPRLAAMNMVLVNNLGDADRILRIDFTPDPAAPNTAGDAVFLGWRINPLRALTYVSSPGTSVSAINYSSGLSAYHSSPYGYDRFGDYSYSSSYWSGTSSPPPAKNPATTPPTQEADTAPAMTPPPRSGAGRFVGIDPDGPGRPGPRPPYPSPRYPASTGGYTSSSSGGSTSSSSSSGSSSSYSSSSSSSYSSGSSSSSGGSSYSSGSSYSGGSSYSSSGSSGSSGSSTSGSSGTHETPTQRQN